MDLNLFKQRYNWPWTLFRSPIYSPVYIYIYIHKYFFIFCMTCMTQYTILQTQIHGLKPTTAFYLQIYVITVHDLERKCFWLFLILKKTTL